MPSVTLHEPGEATKSEETASTKPTDLPFGHIEIELPKRIIRNGKIIEDTKQTIVYAESLTVREEVRLNALLDREDKSNETLVETVDAAGRIRAIDGETVTPPRNMREVWVMVDRLGDFAFQELRIRKLMRLSEAMEAARQAAKN